MLKIFSIALLIVCVLVDVDAGTRSCTSCGNECVPACGTRRFRTCCFNYLRRKRVPEVKIDDYPSVFEDYATYRTLLEESEKPTGLLSDDISNRHNMISE